MLDGLKFHSKIMCCDYSSTGTFNVKYRRKVFIITFIQMLAIWMSVSMQMQPIDAFNCTTDESCKNGGFCRNNACICPDGWQGSDCQFCGGKVKLTEPEGVIHDGFGNYSVSVKCSWLIDARHTNWSNRYPGGNKKPAKIRLHLEEFATECGWDHLYIYDGDSVESPLLAVYSGLMYRKNFSIRKVPEIVAQSGSALLHFFSDDAYNMSGFNISYKVNGCPTNNSSLDCSGHGKCRTTDATCICDALYTGEACNIHTCANGCSFHLKQGECKKSEGRCECYSGFTGYDCSQISALGVWTTVSAQYSPPPPGSASHGAAVWRDTLHIIGGESYDRGELLNMYDFNGNVWEAVHIEGGTSVPEIRYGVSTVMYGDKIFMYGGVIRHKGICGELWAFDVSAKTWENITVKAEPCNETSFTMCGPLKVVGHTATLVPGFGDKSTYQYMVVIFGHSPQYGYLNTVQEYNFGSREWRIVETNGYVVKGGYGHSAAYDMLTEKIYVYGGIVSESENSQVLSSKLYAYEPATRTWTLLTSALSSRLLHTANFVTPGLMLVFGGNTHNDTSQSYGAKCYSKDLMVYDVFCDSWQYQDIPSDLVSDLARFGHSSAVFEDSLYIYGGFDGQLLSDMLKYTPGNCNYFTKQEKCLNSKPGVKCIWDVQKSRCISIDKVQKASIFGREQYDYIACPVKSRITMTSELLNDVTRCHELTNCQSCLSNSFGCIYCGNGSCSKDKCRDAFYDGRPIVIKKLSECPKEIGTECEHLHCCYACSANTNCIWEMEQNRCRPFIGNRTIDSVDIQCPPPCANLTSCGNCTEEECIWCQNEQRCVDRNAYTASFPYGQCREWTTHPSKCRPEVSGSQCGFYKTCNQCRDDPACGWCDDGSNTGLGECLPGGASGPQDVMECSATQWYFTSCPDCQCNGHSICQDKYNCDQPCSNLTMGRNCEKCKSGYWGNPVNGGQCQKCECNNQGSLCNSETGKCFCQTKGIVGDHCEKCDSQNHYHGDPLKSSCYYDLTIDYQFTFNLSKKEDRHFTQINFRNSPGKPDIDADFTITCSVAAKMNITVRKAGTNEKYAFTGINCSTFRHRFSKTEYHFGANNEDNTTLTTFYVYVYDFQPPIWIQIAFSQYPKLNLQQFFITFSTCFLMLLLMAAILWKIKQKYDMFRRRQRLFVEMEQMASRPFSQVLVEIENREHIDLTQTIESISTAARKRKKDCPSPIALEPCNGNRAAVLSLLVRLPTGGLQHAPPGQAAGLAVASALVTLGNPRRPSLEHQKEPKTKRKQSQHPDSCT